VPVRPVLFGPLDAKRIHQRLAETRAVNGPVFFDVFGMPLAGAALPPRLRYALCFAAIDPAGGSHGRP